MSRANLCLSPYGYAGAGRNLLVFGSFSALKPSHSHPIRGFARGFLVALAICWHSAACFKNTSAGLIGVMGARFLDFPSLWTP